MESLLLLLPLLACPLGMAAIGAAGWLWAKASGATKEKSEEPAPSSTAGEVAGQRA
jgi:hypothetical protein